MEGHETWDLGRGITGSHHEVWLPRHAWWLIAEWATSLVED